MKVEQCLFGYEDGHRLLASSIDLAEELSSLVELSDLAPGAVFSESAGYWSGIPLPQIGRYALMRTWPAPEMSRPGCVWTHALLLAPEALELVQDLAALAQLARRPSSPSERQAYRSSIDLDPVLSPTDPALDNRPLARRILSALYGDSSAVVGITSPGEADSTVFTVWSQQWPRLRRNFRFQTAATLGSRGSSAHRLDLTLRLDAPPAEPHAPFDEGWINAAVEDLESSKRQLRRFLWKYGHDVRKQRGSFRPLVEIFLLAGSTSSAVGPKVLAIVRRSFSDLRDASRLKQDLIDGKVAPAAQLSLLSHALEDKSTESFPPPSSAGVRRMTELWSNRSHDLLHLAEVASENSTMLGHLIFDTVSSAMPVDQFWSLTRSFPRLRDRMVVTRPALLDADAADSIDDAKLEELLSKATLDAQTIAELMPRIARRDSASLSELVLSLAPEVVTQAILQFWSDQTPPVGHAWRRAIFRSPALLLERPAALERVGRSSLVLVIAEALGWLSPVVIEAGVDPWIAALKNASGDLSDDQHGVLSAFLVGLAVAETHGGGQSLLETCFRDVHERAFNSRLSWKARELLAPFLPEVSWARSWDLSYRLRLMATHTYVRKAFDAASFARLLGGNSYLDELLFEAASEVRGAEALARAVGKK